MSGIKSIGSFFLGKKMGAINAPISQGGEEIYSLIYLHKPCHISILLKTIT
jgi:hypothetical protein